VAEGIRVVEDLVASDLTVRWAVSASSIEDSERGGALCHALAARGILHRRVDDRDFEAIAGTETPQGVLAVADIPTASLADVAAAASPAVVLVLDAVQDPGNFGTLVRSAEAFGAAGVVALPGTVDPWNPKAVRSAVGSSFRIPIVQGTWSDVRLALTNSDYELLGADMEGTTLGSPPDRAALVVGNEGSGLSDEVRSTVGRLVAVPTRGRGDSLNVASAAAILLYELTR